MMDWQSGEGEENEGMIGSYINFGAIGKDHVVDAQEGPDGEKIEISVKPDDTVEDVKNKVDFVKCF